MKYPDCKDCDCYHCKYRELDESCEECSGEPTEHCPRMTPPDSQGNSTVQGENK